MDSKNFSARTKGVLCCFTGLLLPLAVALVFAAGTASTVILESMLGKSGLVTLNAYLVGTFNGIVALSTGLPQENEFISFDVYSLCHLS